MNQAQNIQTVATQYGTFAIDSVRDKKMMTALINGNYPNEVLLQIARLFVNRQSIVLDVGAHIGTFAIPIASAVAEVIAFEPSAEACTLLSRNAGQNHVKLRLICSALGREKGTGTLIVRNISNAGANTLVSGGSIPVTTLDAEVSDVDFIKIDVEGMELEVLRGGVQLIERTRPVILFEVNLAQLRAHKTSPRALECFFMPRDYRLYFPIHRGTTILARVQSISLLTALIAPRSWFFFGDSAPFDLIAVPKEREISSVSFLSAIMHVIAENLINKKKRISSCIASCTRDRGLYS